MTDKFSITTRTGDQGSTRLFSGEEVPKDSLRTDAYGDADELCSVLGLARATGRDEDVRAAVEQIQRELFIINAELATTPGRLAGLKDRVDDAMLKELDRRREALEAKVKMPAGFVIPGGTVAGAHLDHARTIARRCERKVTGLRRSGDVTNPIVLVWLNRLSDYLWLLARREEGDAMLPKDG
jgi:cob(I)alamin adenosyltransferase